MFGCKRHEVSGNLGCHVMKISIFYTGHLVLLDYQNLGSYDVLGMWTGWEK